MNKKWLYPLLLILSVVLIIVVSVATKSGGNSLGEAKQFAIPEGEKIEYILFHLDTCPHCHDEIKFINNKLLPMYGDYIDLKMYEVSDQENAQLFEQYASYYRTSAQGVPTAFIDGKVVNGYGNDDTTGAQIVSIIESGLQRLENRFVTSSDDIATSTESVDVEPIDESVLDTPTTNSVEGDENISTPLSSAVVDSDSICAADGSCVTIPVLGKIDPKSFSLPLLTVIIGLLDGFNPCAMWVLLFLISLLLGMHNRKRMWLLGSIFIVVSGAVYFIFMAAWLQFLLFIGMITIIRLIIGLVAIGVGGINMKDFWVNRKYDGVVCKVSSKEGTKKTFAKIKDVVYKKNLWLSIIGISILAFSVNLVELACSAGFPAIFTQVLAINEISMFQRYLYMLGYIFFYMLDDMIVFAIAMLTLKSKTVGGQYAKYANLIGGVLIFILGILIIFKPEWLSFG